MIFITFVCTSILLAIDYGYITNTIYSHASFIYYSLCILTLINNIYQVFTHILTALKFLSLRLDKDVYYTPGGAEDGQSLKTFIFWNIVDQAGWIGYALVIRK
jgi:hypothetical protein